MPAAGGGRAEPGPLRQRESRQLPGRPAAPPAAARPAALALVTILSFASRFHRLAEPSHVWYGLGRGLCPGGRAVSRGHRACGWVSAPSRRRPRNSRSSVSAPTRPPSPVPQPPPAAALPGRGVRVHPAGAGAGSRQWGHRGGLRFLPGPAVTAALGTWCREGTGGRGGGFGNPWVAGCFLNKSKLSLEWEEQTRGSGVLMSNSLGRTPLRTAEVLAVVFQRI